MYISDLIVSKGAVVHSIIGVRSFECQRRNLSYLYFSFLPICIIVLFLFRKVEYFINLSQNSIRTRFGSEKLSLVWYTQLELGAKSYPREERKQYYGQWSNNGHNIMNRIWRILLYILSLFLFLFIIKIIF